MKERLKFFSRLLRAQHDESKACTAELTADGNVFSPQSKEVSNTPQLVQTPAELGRVEIKGPVVPSNEVNNSPRLTERGHDVPDRDPIQAGPDTALQRYDFTPLTAPDEIRIFSLWPQKHWHATYNEHRVPMGTMRHARLSERPDYNCLSYAWGDVGPSNSYPILVDGNCLMVTKSLFEALHAIENFVKNEDDIAALWADQISIDQRNMDERGQQVSLMTKIYEQGQLTVAYLGPGTPEIAMASKLTSIYSRRYDTPIPGQGVPPSKTEEEVLAILAGMEISPDMWKSALQGMGDLVERPWFTRLWTFQEAVLSHRVLYCCGPTRFHGVEIMDFCRLASTIDRNWNFRTIRIGTIFRVARSREDGKVPSLLDLLGDMEHLKYRSTDSRDRIYALLGLQPGPGMPGHCNIIPNYTKAYRDVLIDAAKEIYRATGKLDMQHPSRKGKVADLPSWATDWAAERMQAPLFATHKAFDASNGLMYDLEASDGPGVLLAHGRILAEVVARPPRCYDETGLQADLVLDRDDIEAMLSAIQDTGAYESLQDQITVLARTLACEDLQRWLEDMSIGFELSQAGDLLDLVRTRQGKYKQYELRRIITLRHPTFVVALGPWDACVNDVLCILHGAPTPVLLRKVGSQYRFIGQCFVHGIMHGEAVDWAIQDADKFELIRVCLAWLSLATAAPK